MVQRTGKYYQQEFPEVTVIALSETQYASRSERRKMKISQNLGNQPYRKSVNIFGDEVEVVNGDVVLAKQAQAALERSGE